MQSITNVTRRGGPPRAGVRPPRVRRHLHRRRDQLHAHLDARQGPAELDRWAAVAGRLHVVGTDPRAPCDGLEGAAAMSWAAHQFEYYAIQGHLPQRWLGKISFLAIVVGDQTCDLVGKVWSYGFEIGGTHYGPEEPSQWHRGWPGLGMTHSLLWAFVAGGITYLLTRNRAWTLGVGLGAAAHAITDISDTVGTMLAFPFNTQTFSYGAWAYAATTRRRQVPRRCGVLQQLGLRDGRAVVRHRPHRVALSHPHLLEDERRGGRSTGVGMARPAPAGAGAGDPVPVMVHLRDVPAHRLDVVGPRHRGLRVGLHVGWAELDPPSPAVPSRARGGGGCLDVLRGGRLRRHNGAAQAPRPGVER